MKNQIVYLKNPIKTHRFFEKYVKTQRLNEKSSKNSFFLNPIKTYRFFKKLSKNS